MYVTGGISIIVSLFVTIYLRKWIEELAQKISPNYKFATYTISVLILLIIIGASFNSLINKSLKKRNLYNICLKVIEDIEKEKEKKEKEEKERLENIKTLLDTIYKTSNEAAIAKEDKVKFRK